MSALTLNLIYLIVHMSMKSSTKVIKSVYGFLGNRKKNPPLQLLFYLNGILDGELKYFLEDLNFESQVFSSSQYHLLSNETKRAIKARAKPMRLTENGTFEV